MAEIHFVLSAPRSGSTWLARSLNFHDEIFATEHRLFGDFCEIWPNNDGTTAPRITSDSYVDAFAMHYLFGEMDMSRQEFTTAFQRAMINFLISFGTRRTGKSMVVDKITPYSGTCRRVLDQIETFAPQAKLFLLMRDGRDVLTSGTFDWLRREPKDSPRYQFFVEKNEQIEPQRFFDDQVIRDWAEHWREVAECGAKTEVAATITYEDMKANHESCLQSLFKSLGVKSSPAIAKKCSAATTFENLTGRKAGDQRQGAKARKGVVGDWKNFFTRKDAELFHSIAGNELIRYGYESNADWVDELPDQLAWDEERSIRK